MWARLRSLVTMICRRSQWERDVRDELEFHIEARAAALEREGVPREEAVRRARRRFHSMAKVKEDCREARGARWVDETLHNLTCALRSIRQHPGVSTVAVISLALGIGANLAVFGVLQRLLLTPLPVRDPGQLYHVVVASSVRSYYAIPFPKFAVIRDNFDLFTLFGWGGFGTWPVTIADAPEPRYVLGVTGNYFDMLGVRPVVGRLFDEGDEQEKVADVAVISHALWRSAFAENGRVLGRSIDIQGKVYSIIGVTPAGFPGFEPGNPADVYLTLHGIERLVPNALKGPGRNWVHPVARMKPGVPVEQAHAIVRDRWAELDEPNRLDFMRNTRDVLVLEPAGHGFSAAGQEFTPALLVLMGLVAAVFLIACANVATLLFVRGADRVREMSIRLALGAARAQLVRQWLSECVLLATAAGLAGLMAARWMTDGLLLFVAEADRTWLRFNTDITTVLVTLGLTGAAALACGLMPAIRATAPAPDAALRAHGGTPAHRGTLAQTVLAAQLAASLVLVFGGATFARTLWNLNHADPGYDRRAVLYALPDFSRTTVRGEQSAARVIDDVVARLRGSDLVAGVSQGDAPTIWANGGWAYVHNVSDYTLSPGEDNTVWSNNVLPEYFGVMGLPLLAGRNFSPDDRPPSGQLSKTMIVNQRFARHYFGDRDPIGQFVNVNRATSGSTQIIGVVKDARNVSLRTPQRDEVYRPIAQGGWSMVVARPRQDVPASAVMALMRTVIQEAAKDLTAEIAPLEAALQKTFLRDRLVARLSMAFAALGILLAVIGLYAAIAHSVSSRTREIGIRIAIGAAAHDVMWMVLRQGVALTAVALAVGLPVAMAGSWLIRSLLFEVSPADPVVLGVSTVLLALTGLAAGVWPARRAAKLDPSQTLRFE